MTPLHWLEWQETKYVPQDKRQPAYSWQAKARDGLAYVVAQEDGNGKWCWVRYKDTVDAYGHKFVIADGKDRFPTRQDAMDAAQADADKQS